MKFVRILTALLGFAAVAGAAAVGFSRHIWIA